MCGFSYFVYETQSKEKISMKIQVLGILLLLPIFGIMILCGPGAFAEEHRGVGGWLTSTASASGAEPDGREGFGVAIGSESASSDVGVCPDATASSDATVSADAAASGTAEPADATATASADSPQVTLDGVVDVDTYLNIRTGPWGKIIGGLNNKVKVQIISKQGDWFQILYHGEIAYIHAYYVSAPGFPSH
ncbi:MAG TPA: SH3 domain-containing protein, partial [Candidatus Ozemobacteraceae bacterium]|nr:SH3 domain-containing protein [Candidatus Ozemobacteraceae bacterium]